VPNSVISDFVQPVITAQMIARTCEVGMT